MPLCYVPIFLPPDRDFGKLEPSVTFVLRVLQFAVSIHFVLHSIAIDVPHVNVWKRFYFSKTCSVPRYGKSNYVSIAGASALQYELAALAVV